MEYFFLKRPNISDMVRVLKRLNYRMNGNRIMADNNNIRRYHNIRSEFQITKIKFSDVCDCKNHVNQCCDICTGWNESIKDKDKSKKWTCHRCGELVKETKNGKRCGCKQSPSPWEPVKASVKCPDCSADLKINGDKLQFVKHHS